MFVFNNLKLKILFCLITLPNVFRVEVDGSPRGYNTDMKDLMESSQTIIRKQILKYGDSCSYSDEQKRQEIGEKIIRATLNPEDSSLISAAARDMKRLASSSGQFCNSMRLFACGQNGKCVCTREAAMGIRMHSAYENGSCNLVEGNLCIPAEVFQTMSTNSFGQIDYPCGFGTTCKVIRTKQACSMNTMRSEIISMVSGGQLTDTESIMRSVTSICQCTK